MLARRADQASVPGLTRCEPARAVTWRPFTLPAMVSYQVIGSNGIEMAYRA